LRKTLKGIIADELASLPATLDELPRRERIELVIKLCRLRCRIVFALYIAPIRDNLN
jgi:hypothetical protein